MLDRECACEWDVLEVGMCLERDGVEDSLSGVVRLVR